MAEATSAVPFVPEIRQSKMQEYVRSLEAEDPARFEPELVAKDDDFIRFAHSAVQGLRDEMEDRYSYHLDVIKEFFPHEAKDSKIYIAFFGLFDGHGGNRCADFCSRQLLEVSLRVLSPSNTVSELLQNLGDDRLLKKCFVEADETFRQSDRVVEREAAGKKVSGSTAVATWILVAKDPSTREYKYDVVVASAGDSRCVLYDRGQTLALTRDHKPTDQAEMERIYDAGGFVSRKRVNSCLAMSRAMGDFKFKQAPGLPPDLQAVTPVPDVHRAAVSPDTSPFSTPTESRESMDTRKDAEEEKDKEEGRGHHLINKLKTAVDHMITEETSSSSNTVEKDLSFVIMACDGVWDVMSNEEATAYVARRLAKKTRRGSIGGGKDTSGRYPLDRICKNLCDHCIKELGSTDNVSVSVIQFKRV